MKTKSILLSAILCLSALVLQAQQYDALDQVRSDIRKSYGMEGPHRFDAPSPLTKAPAGYKPFYINHYGRHGSRYAWNSKTYLIIRDALEKARELNVLTPYGKAFAEKYEAFYLEPWVNSGDLVPLGFEQHQRIGEFVIDAFPAVFKGSRRVEAIASTAQRCIVSMGAFNLGLKSRNGKLQIYQGSNHKGMEIVAPPSAPKSYARHFQGENDESSMESSESFWNRTVDSQSILDKLFTESSFLDELKGGKDTFVSELYSLYCGYHNYEPAPLFDDLLTEDQRVRMWEADNYGSFRVDLTARYSVIPLLEDFIAKADAAFADPTLAANLRFGHDYILEAFACLLDIDHCGTIPQNPDDVKYWFQNYNIPMAATLLFVYYRNKKGDILFKALLNEKEVTLPQLEPVKGPYYRWSDFLSWAQGVMAAHPEVL